jgi:hypothetical protein
LSKLYLNDYCVWIQYQNDNFILKFVDEIEKILKDFSKKNVELFDLEELENVAKDFQNDNYEDDPMDFESPFQLNNL